MTPDEFRRHGREVIDWIADYMERVEQLPVLSQVKPGEVRGRLTELPPEQGEPFEAILKDVNEIILPGVTHWQSPNFFAYFPCNNSGPSILGELLSAGLGVQGMLWATSPACTELETLVLDWLVEALALPEQFRSTGAGGGVIQDTASSATLCAILAARENVRQPFQADTPPAGQAGKPDVLVAYASTQTHSSIDNDLRIAGLTTENLCRIEVDDDFAMRPDKLAEAIRTDIAAGRKPFFVCATTGTTSSLAFDPLRAIGEICRRHGIWLHVDAAMAGTAAICPEFRAMHDGLELADSYCFNPHKWMFTNFDCSCFYVADRGPLLGALSILPEYLKNQATLSGGVIDYRDWQIPLGRRFRALKLWFVLRSFGIEGIQARIRNHIALARDLASWITADSRFELVPPQNLNLVCLRHRSGDDATQRILDRVNASGKLYISHTKLNNRLTLRFCVGQTNVERRHVEAAWEEICKESEPQATNNSIDICNLDSQSQQVFHNPEMTLRELIAIHSEAKTVLCRLCRSPLVFALTGEQAAINKGPLGIYCPMNKNHMSMIIELKDVQHGKAD
jgi:aromatic-L-amino-acid decarboxylase